MKKKIMFDEFENADGTLNREAQAILDLLRKHYDVELSDTPDYIFGRAGSTQYYRYDGIRIFCTIEALCPDFNLCDYATGFENLVYGDRYLRLPNFYFYVDAVKQMNEKHLDINQTLADRKFCSFVYSNSRADEMRTILFETLSAYKKVDSGGRYMNNQPNQQPVMDKVSFEREHKFSIACENASHPGYHTEKLVEAFAAQTVPIYWGDPDVGKVFNEKAFIDCNAYGSVQEAIDRIIYLDSHPDEYLQMLREPALLPEARTVDGLQCLEEYLIHIFEQPLEQAYRRNRGFWGEQYLQTMRSERRIIEMYMRFKETKPICMLRKLLGK